MEIILASKSPRRQELLKNIGISQFIIQPAEDEEEAPEGLSPGETVCRIAMQKARSVSEKCVGDFLVIAADTLVYLDGRPLGKPADKRQAEQMLRSLSGKTHTVYTGVSLIYGIREISEFEASEVTFQDMTDDEITAYVATGEPMDKAGAYGVQGFGAVFVKKIDGDFFNVMGLPLCRLYNMLKELEIIIL